MTLRELLAAAGARPLLLALFLCSVPVAAWIVGLLHQPGVGNRSPWKYLYSLLVFLACIPGMLAAVVTLYGLLLAGESLLDLDLLVSLLPVCTMVVTLVLVRRTVELDEVPGFDRLSGLMITIALSILVLLVIQKTRIWVLFGASLWVLVGAGVVIYLLFRWAARLLLGQHR